jgi:hypothetical protein
LEFKPARFHLTLDADDKYPTFIEKVENLNESPKQVW